MKTSLLRGFLGDILAVDIQGNDGSFVNKESPVHWRQDRDLSGFNILNMGIWYETLMRWVGPATSVQAMTTVNINRRRDDQGRLAAIYRSRPR